MGSFGLDRSRYQTILLGCVRKGFTYVLSPEECNIILKDLALPFVYEKMTAIMLLNYMNDIIYERYHNGSVVRLLSPDMQKPVLVNYNFMAFQKLHRDIYGTPSLILRAEHNPLEERAPLTPEDLSKLHGDFTLFVETSATRCYSDETYRQVGATIVPAGYWATSPHSYVIGLKEIQANALPTQTLMHFAHCFKGQEDAPKALSLLKGSTFIDYEYMLREKKRVISFCGQSGKVGCYLALMSFYRKADLPPFEEAMYRDILSKEEVKPKVLLIGYGTVGKACKAVMDQFGIECTIWTSKDRIDKEIILAHDIMINAIRLSDDPMMKSEPFLLLEDLTAPARLSVICDISCDMGNPRNTLPIYTEYTSKVQPVHMITDTVSLIAINNLPSLEPAVSSQEFSSILVEFLPKLLHYPYSKTVDSQSAVLYGSYEKFLKVLREFA
jgi:saccharopine dehydrogenase (NAD+, L-lysine-forming)